MSEEEKLEQIGEAVKKIDASLTDITVFNTRLEPIIEKVVQHDKTLYGDDTRDGLRMDMDRSKEREKRRDMQMKLILGGLVTLAVSGIVWLLTHFDQAFHGK